MVNLHPSLWLSSMDIRVKSWFRTALLFISSFPELFWDVLREQTLKIIHVLIFKFSVELITIRVGLWENAQPLVENLWTHFILELYIKSFDVLVRSDFFFNLLSQLLRFSYSENCSMNCCLDTPPELQTGIFCHSNVFIVAYNLQCSVIAEFAS